MPRPQPLPLRRYQLKKQISANVELFRRNWLTIQKTQHLAKPSKYEIIRLQGMEAHILHLEHQLKQTYVS